MSNQNQVQISENTVETAPLGKGRKKTILSSTWKRSEAKLKRHSSKGSPVRCQCEHTHKCCYKCADLTMQDIRSAHKMFYDKADKIKQDEIILRFTQISPVKKNKLKKYYNKEESIKYFLPKRLQKLNHKKIRVCKAMFLSTFQVGKRRVEGVCKRNFNSGQFPTEKRGRDVRTELYLDRKLAVKNFIEKIQPIQSHYNRSKNTKKHYLPSELSIKTLCNMYNESNENTIVNYEYFRNIFCLDYNISFRSPATDCCSTCIKFKENINSATSSQEKSKLQTLLRVHQLKAEQFYKQLKKENEGVLNLSFDCQKNQTLPKTPDQKSYYLRQLYLYNFTICVGSSKDKQTKENTFIYTWLENEHRKGSNEIASCLFNRLNNTNLESIHTIQLFSDGCGGQNKNQIVIGMLCTWLTNKAPANIKKVVCIYPIVGHSYLPPDRVFGRLEKKIKKQINIIKPEEYLKIFETEGTVMRVSSNNGCPVYDWKTAIKSVMKSPSAYHFQFAPSKRFIITKNLKGIPIVQGEVNYLNDIGTSKTLLKRRKSFINLNINLVETGVPVKEAKKKDVAELLCVHYGEYWKNDKKLDYYKSVLEDATHDSNHESDFDEIMENDIGTI